MNFEPRKLTDDDLVHLVDDFVASSQTAHTEVSAERRASWDQYYSRPYGNEQKGRSRYVSSDVLETVEWAVPQLIDVFASTDRAVEFEPEGPEDEELAAQMTDYANYIFYRKNSGFLALHDWLKSALLLKNTCVKVYPKQVTRVEKETYRGLDDAELAFLLSGDDLEVFQHTAKPATRKAQQVDPQTGAPVEVEVPYQLHDVVVGRRNTRWDIKIEVVPPEEIIVSSAARSMNLDQAPAVAHHRQIPVSDLREMGLDFDESRLRNDGGGIEVQSERESRLSSALASWSEDNSIDTSRSLVWITEAYIAVDWDHDGVSELRKVIKVGDQILENEEVDFIPLVSFCPVPTPHLHYGLSFADLVADLQLLKSMLTRSAIDNAFLANFPSRAVDINKIVDPSDLLKTGQNVVVKTRGNPAEAIAPLPPQQTLDSTLGFLAYVDNAREARTGISKQFQGLDPNALSNTTATGAQITMTAAQQRIKLVARIFAEAALAQLFKKICKLAARYSQREQIIRLRNKWVPINPAHFKDLEDVTVNVGLGTGDKISQFGVANQLLEIQKALNAGDDPKWVALAQPQHVQHCLYKLVELAGFKNPESFFAPIDSQEYQQALAVLTQRAAQKQQSVDVNSQLVQLEAEKSKQDVLLKSMEFELKKLQADREFVLKQKELELKHEIELIKAGVPLPALAQEIKNEADAIGSAQFDSQLIPQEQMALLNQIAMSQGQPQPPVTGQVQPQVAQAVGVPQNIAPAAPQVAPQAAPQQPPQV